jgi:DNA mismatch repair ATPase MutL
MGAIRSVINSFDGSEELAQTQKELITTLANLAETKAQLFETQVRQNLLEAGTKGNQTIPISTIITSTTETHAYTQESAKLIPDAVQSSLTNFVPGGNQDIVKGVGGLISTAVTAFFGEASAGNNTLEKYYIIAEGLSIVRVDLHAWSMDIAAESIKSKLEKVSAFVAVKSAVDVSKVDYNTFLNVYQEQLTTAGIESKVLAEALDEAHKIYQRFHGLSSGKQTHAKQNL